MPSHFHRIIGTNKDKLENIMRDMKRHTSEKLKLAIQTHPKKSRRDWLLEMMEKAGEENSNNASF
jgi:putative transposase